MKDSQIEMILNQSKNEMNEMSDNITDLFMDTNLLSLLLTQMR